MLLSGMFAHLRTFPERSGDTGEAEEGSQDVAFHHIVKNPFPDLNSRPPTGTNLTVVAAAAL